MENLSRENKYGEIILEKENTFRIYCDLCSDTFLTLENFRYHVFKHLQNTDSEDSTDSFLDFIFQDDTDTERVTNLEIEINPAGHEDIIGNLNVEKINEHIDNVDTIESIVKGTDNIEYNETMDTVEPDITDDEIDNENFELIIENTDDIDANESIENILHTTDETDNFSLNNLITFRSNIENAKNIKLNINLMQYHGSDENEEYNYTTDTDDDDSIKTFHNLEQKQQHDFNVIRDKLRNIFKLYKDYCPICLHRFSCLTGLIKHTKIHLRDLTKEEIIKFYKNSLKQNGQNSISNSNIKETITKDAWEKVQKLKCLYCDKTFVHNRDLERHKNTHLQNNMQILTCKICYEKFNSNYKYSCHMFDKHNVKEPFECDRCPQTFKKFGFLVRHLRFHNDDKRYECEYCGKRFMENKQRKLHIRSHHTNEKLCQCDECGITFASISQFKMHQLRHTNKKKYNCTKCDKKFFTSYSLKNHFVIHTKEKPYQCDVCNAKFGMRGSLWTHRRLHSNEKKYKCKICAKSFLQSAGLHSHMRTHCLKEKSSVN